MTGIISPTPRVRSSPYYEATLAEGADSFTVYNHMLMPGGFGDPEDEYWRLIEGVSMWDVAAERQVQLKGPDAAVLAQALAPRQVAHQEEGMGWYVPICDHRGVLQNDPILLKLSEDRFWLSIADSDVRLWALAVAGERGLDVEVSEPDVSPLAVQGPKAEDVIASIFDESVRSMGYFRFREFSLGDIPVMLARSGWSKQGGFEIYLMDGACGTDLWNIVKEAGQPFGIGPGTPNQIERIESGLLSWGGDTDENTNPFEVRMTKFVDLDCPDDTIGIKALRRIKEEGVKRHQLGVVLQIDGQLTYMNGRGKVFANDAYAGLLTATTTSRRMQKNIGIMLVSRDVKVGDPVLLELPDGRTCDGEAVKLPFI
ncbi:MAG: glycine cleavage system protein T [Pseudomonadota bacterium]